MTWPKNTTFISKIRPMFLLHEQTVIKMAFLQNKCLFSLQSVESVSHSVVPNALWPHGLQSTRLLCPWDFPGKKTGVGCHFLLQGIFPIQGSNSGLLHCRQILYHLSYREASYSNKHFLYIYLLSFDFSSPVYEFLPGFSILSTTFVWFWSFGTRLISHNLSPTWV